MKKSTFILAAAALALGFASCTDEPIIPEIEGGSEVVAGVRVKSVADLVGTEWTYTMDDMTFDDGFGNTVTIPMDDLVFGLEFGTDVAHLSFPENMVMLSLNEDYTLEELEGMGFAYTYEAATTSGTLTATDNDITGETIDLTIPFTYNEATDAININLGLDYGDEEEPVYMQLVFNRK
ncbi:MAG: hypothetical protein IJ760_02250 [Bacteroidales bacterium]|nr:hypothetical protein [Bacteroidales bacterium]